MYNAAYPEALGGRKEDFVLYHPNTFTYIFMFFSIITMFIAFIHGFRQDKTYYETCGDLNDPDEIEFKKLENIGDSDKIKLEEDRILDIRLSDNDIQTIKGEANNDLTVQKIKNKYDRIGDWSGVTEDVNKKYSVPNQTIPEYCLSYNES